MRLFPDWLVEMMIETLTRPFLIEVFMGTDWYYDGALQRWEDEGGSCSNRY